jgi:hypothetical protein
MKGIGSFGRSLRAAAFEGRQFRRHLASRSRVFHGWFFDSHTRCLVLTNNTEGDTVLIKEAKDAFTVGKLTKPLSSSGRIETHRGILTHSSIIGKRCRDTVTTSKGVAFRLYEPSLAEYVTLTPRLVTPVRPKALSYSILLKTPRLTRPSRYTRKTPI